jgi:uncharacterized protein YuzB (UPF0349 family)
MLCVKGVPISELEVRGAFRILNYECSSFCFVCVDGGWN